MIKNVSGTNADQLNIKSGEVTGGNGNGGNLDLQAGNGSGNGVGGGLVLGGGDSGASGGSGGTVTIAAGGSSGVNLPGGGISIAAGGSDNGDGGTVGINSGYAFGGNKNGGDITFDVGSGSGTGRSGHILFLPYSSGNVGIGTTTPRASLDINGTIVGKTSTLNSTATINFGSGNIQHTTSDCGAFDLWNLKDGASYIFAVKGTTSATCSFTAYSDNGLTSLTVHLPPDHGATITGKHTIYNLAISGGDAYLAWTPGY